MDSVSESAPVSAVVAPLAERDDGNFKSLFQNSEMRTKINGSLLLHDTIQAAVILLQYKNPILQDSGRLADLDGHLMEIISGGIKNSGGTVQEMENQLEPRVPGQVDTIWIILMS